MKKTVLSLMLLGVLCALGSCGDDDKDMERPVIQDNPATDFPLSCDVYHLGDTIPLCMVFTDNVGLASFTIDIHHNFDHHTHGTSSVECPLEERMSDEEIKKLERANAVWIYKNNFRIPAGTQTYTARVSIPVPTDIHPGDYHFKVSVMDQNQWEEYKAISIKIAE